MHYAMFISPGNREPVYIRPTAVLRIKKDPTHGYTVLDLISGMQVVEGSLDEAVKALRVAEEQ
jgi:hypothetical protein